MDGRGMVEGWLLLGLLLLTWLGVPPLLRALPEPEEGPGYRRLAGHPTPALHAAVLLLVGLLGLGVPEIRGPLWWPLLSVGLAAAVVDARSTWIPRQLCWLGWGLLAPAAALGWWLDPGSGPTAVAGAAAATVLFWLVWRLGRGQLGFSDVRIAPLVGLAAASSGWAGWWWSLLLGTALGALLSLVRAMLGRTGAMPYAPALVAGPFLAAALRALTG